MGCWKVYKEFSRQKRWQKEEKSGGSQGVERVYMALCESKIERGGLELSLRINFHNPAFSPVSPGHFVTEALESGSPGAPMT